LDAFGIMPDHMHGIVRFNTPGINHNDPPRDVVRRDVACNVSTPDDASTNDGGSGGVAVPPGRGSLGAFARSYKAAVTRWCRMNGYADFGWQPRFYDRIVRDEAALRSIRRYILSNPARWMPDETDVYG
jgi:putative transposase